MRGLSQARNCLRFLKAYKTLQYIAKQMKERLRTFFSISIFIVKTYKRIRDTRSYRPLTSLPQPWLAFSKQTFYFVQESFLLVLYFDSVLVTFIIFYFELKSWLSYLLKWFENKIQLLLKMMRFFLLSLNCTFSDSPLLT